MPGYAERVSITVDPAAGADVTFSATEQLVLRSFTGNVTTSATVANRQVIAQVEDSSGNVLWRAESPTVLAASIAAAPIEGYPDAPGISPGGNHSNVTLPLNGVQVRAGDVIRITLLNKQAGDDFTAFVLQLERT